MALAYAMPQWQRKRSETMGARVIYDFGMNNGDDVEYYLLKADRVVGVEANKSLCEEVARRFSAEIDNGRFVVLNVALAASESAGRVPFYLHKTNHVLSQLPRPADGELANFEKVEVPCRTAASIVQEFGEPWYVKIDVEHFDLPVLENLFSAGIAPPEISAEAHDAAVFASLVANGYRSFNLVDGLSVPRLYGTTQIATPNGSKEFCFKEHSAGPFGEDIRTPWEDPNTFLYTLASAGLGWKDVHASKTIHPQPPPSHQQILVRQAAAVARRAFTGLKGRIAGS
jgi:FkbM family methyltransferase